MSSLPSPGAHRLILPIQYLRGVAAIMVVWFHALGQVRGVPAFFSSGFGASGVDLFFVISGFIMVTTTSHQVPTPLEFIRRRIIRVVPLYWLLTLAMVALALCLPSLFRTLIVTPRTLVESLLFIPHFSLSFPDMAWPLLVPGWTLNYEMFFYGAFACALFLPARLRLGALAGFFGALVIVGYALGPFDSAAAHVYTSPMLIEFVAGAAIGAWWGRGRALTGMRTSIALLAVGLCMLVSRNAPPLGLFTQMIGAVMMVVGALHPSFSRWHFAPLRALGDSSYSLYLTHLFTLGVLRTAWTHVSPAITSWSGAAAFQATALVTASAAGWLVFRYIETPMSSWLNSRTRKRSQPKAAGQQN